MTARGWHEKRYEYQGGQYTMGELMEMSGLSRESIRKKLAAGEPLLRRAPRITYMGEPTTYEALSRQFGIKAATIKARVAHGMTVEEAVMPLQKRRQITPEDERRILQLWCGGDRSIDYVMQETGFSRSELSQILPVDEIEEDEKRRVLRRYGYR